MRARVGGHLPDPPNTNFRVFETQLRPQLALGTGDVDLRDFASKRHDQRQTKSCVAQAVIKALENLERQQLCHTRHIAPSQLREEDHTNLSVLALYYLCRAAMRPTEVHKDAGTYISLACARMRALGVCTEAAWPFDETRLHEAPNLAALWDGTERKISAYYRITHTAQERVSSVIDALRAKHPVVYGTEVGDNWHTYRAGEVLQLSTTPEGGHATHLLGWDETRGVFLGENSWGNAWGDDGFYRIAPEVIAHHSSSDFWVITGTWEVLHP
jgi:C1A family cysteine protease